MFLTLALVVSATAAPLSAQDPSPLDSLAAEAGDGLESSFIPLPVIFYQPETRLGFGATAVYSFYLGRDRDAEEGERILSSTIAPIALYTIRSQIILALRAELLPIGSPYRLLGEASFTKFPNKFWGIGNDTSDDVEEDYTPIAFSLRTEAVTEFVRDWYFGLSFEYAYRELSEVEPGGLLDSGSVPGAVDGDVVAPGLLLIYDTRESVWYPRSSSYHQLRATLADGLFGSDFEYLNASIDLRRYLPIIDTHVLALRAYGAGATRSPPFDLMPQLGGDMTLRGYFEGRYRDLDLLVVQAEYRFPLWRRFGAAVFAAAGQVQPQLAGFSLDAFHTSAGLGLRFLVAEDQGVNLRADFAFGLGESTSGFYLNIGEAF